MPYLSRRQLLLGLGAVALGGAGIAWGGITLRTRQLAEETRIIVTDPTPDPAPPIIDRATWGALPPDHNAPNERGFYSALNPGGWRVYEGALADVYRTVVIHHSVVYEATPARTLAAIQTLHRQTRGWADVAYHYFVSQAGDIYEGRALDVRGAHVAGHNTGSVGVCLLGDFTQSYPTIDQLASTQALLRWLTTTLDLTHLAAHRDFNDWTECPGQHLLDRLETLADDVGLQIGTDGYVAPGAS